MTKIQKNQQVKVKVMKARMKEAKAKVHPAVLLVAVHQVPLGQVPPVTVEGRLHFGKPGVIKTFISYLPPHHTLVVNIIINGYIFHGKLYFVVSITVLKMKFFIKNFFSEYE